MLPLPSTRSLEPVKKQVPNFHAQSPGKNRKLYFYGSLVGGLVVLAAMLSACAQPTAAVPTQAVPTQAPTPVVPTQAPTQAPTPELPALRPLFHNLRHDKQAVGLRRCIEQRFLL